MRVPPTLTLDRASRNTAGTRASVMYQLVSSNPLAWGLFLSARRRSEAKRTAGRLAHEEGGFKTNTERMVRVLQDKKAQPRIAADGCSRRCCGAFLS